ncbi:MAG: 2-C-methyl-D-erythritol 4-phosphate cytidylyltransferase [Spirochaetes bacterium]|nr:2-C-methyl-D-erythritol 4-phosphate cytidylyltransferase [Spirochaetota bacterium]
MKHYAIILAGGLGQRMDSAVPKQFLALDDKPIIIWSIEAFYTSSLFDAIIIAIHPDYHKTLQTLLHEYNIQTTVTITNGGKTRQQSCYNALCSLQCSDNDIVLIHDAARPFITQTMLKNCINTTVQYGACGIYTPVKETIAIIKEDSVVEVLPRNTICAAQTPQCFYYSIIMDAHKKALADSITDATDDISLVLMAGYPVKAITGNYYHNIKITTTEDIAIAHAIIKNNLYH